MTTTRRIRNRLAPPACLIALLLSLSASPAAAQAGVGTAGTFLIRGGSVWTPNGQLMQADVLISDGRIEAVGSVGPVAGAREIDARGKRVYPGMWDAFTPVGLAEIGGIATMNLRSELGDFNPNDRAIVAVNVESEMIAITRST
ncbi:MAG: hypothetical protein PVH00_10975, partial [Gemmatimonadota bacterium]